MTREGSLTQTGIVSGLVPYGWRSCTWHPLIHRIRRYTANCTSVYFCPTLPSEGRNAFILWATVSGIRFTRPHLTEEDRQTCPKWGPLLEVWGRSRKFLWSAAAVDCVSSAPVKTAKASATPEWLRD